MRLLILSDRIPPESAGGAEKIAWGFARGLRDLGHEVHALTATEGAAFDDVRDGIPVTHIHSRWPSRWTAYFTLYHPGVARQIAQVYDRVRPDVIGAFNIHNALTYHSLTLAQRRGIPAALHLQDAMTAAYGKLTHFATPDAGCPVPAEMYKLPPLHNLKQMRLRYNPLRTALIQRVLRRVNALTCSSEALRDALRANGSPAMRVVYPGVDPVDFVASDDTTAALRSRLGLDGKRVILFAGRLTRWKGSTELLRALLCVLPERPDARLLLLTRSTPEQQGLDAPEFAPLLPQIVTGGWLSGEELAAAFRIANTVVTPSTCLDVFPTVNLEAMAAAKPVIATCFGGSPEAVIDGETGFVIQPYDTDVFAERLVQLLDNDALAQRMGQAGHERLTARFTANQAAQRMETIYRELA